MRTSISDFSLVNRVYGASTATFYKVNSNGTRSTVLATLYGSEAGPDLLTNPQKLDSRGRFMQPVYIEEAVIGVVVGPHVSSHETGIIRAPIIARPFLLVTTSTSITLAHANAVIEVDATAGAVDVSLLAAPPTGFSLTVKRVDDTANAARVIVAGGGLIDGDAAKPLGDSDAAAEFFYNGSAWRVISSTPMLV